MHNSICKFTKPVTAWVAAASILATIGLIGMSRALADDTQAKALFKAMSDYLAAQTRMSIRPSRS